MLKYAVLGSGSCANAYIFQLEGFAFAIDNGFSCLEFLRRARRLGFDPRRLSLIFLTHTHADHLKGVETLSRRCRIPVVAHVDLPPYAFSARGSQRVLPVQPSREYLFEPLAITPFLTSHDAPFSLGYHFRLGERRFTLITDTGEVSEEMVAYAACSDVLFLEANYDPAMLEAGGYPEFLKERIRSTQGHLSNLAAISFLNRLSSNGRRRLALVYFCHLSENNNSPARLQEEIDRSLTWRGEYVICPRGAIQEGRPF